MATSLPSAPPKFTWNENIITSKILSCRSRAFPPKLSRARIRARTVDLLSSYISLRRARNVDNDDHILFSRVGAGWLVTSRVFPAPQSVLQRVACQWPEASPGPKPHTNLSGSISGGEPTNPQSPRVVDPPSVTSDGFFSPPTSMYNLL